LNGGYNNTILQSLLVSLLSTPSTGVVATTTHYSKVFWFLLIFNIYSFNVWLAPWVATITQNSPFFPFRGVQSCQFTLKRQCIYRFLYHVFGSRDGHGPNIGPKKDLGTQGVHGVSLVY
jgi:hypothetical protein